MELEGVVRGQAQNMPTINRNKVYSIEDLDHISITNAQMANALTPAQNGFIRHDSIRFCTDNGTYLKDHFYQFKTTLLDGASWLDLGALGSGSDITITTTAGSESISDGTNTLNVMTRDTAQTITGRKSFTDTIKIGTYGSLSPDTAGTQLDGGYHSNYMANNYHKFSLGNSSTMYLCKSPETNYTATLVPATLCDLGQPASNYGSTQYWRNFYLSGNISDGTNSISVANIVAKSTVSVSDTGTATDEVNYITVNGVEKKLPSGAQTIWREW